MELNKTPLFILFTVFIVFLSYNIDLTVKKTNPLQETDLHIEILSWELLEDVPSASGIVKFKEGFYAIGDDSPYLFHLNKNFNPLSRTRIHSSEKLDGATIPKFDKPDFEAMEMVSETQILIFGSGSKSPERDVCVLVELGKEIIYKEFNIALFYEYLRNAELMQGFELNIEALAFEGDLLHLFNRGRNIIFSFSYTEFITYCKTGENFPIPKIKLFSLPQINGLEAGFSGATISKNQHFIIFTAAVEDAPNAYEDGEILGSFIGLMAIKNGVISDDFLIEQIPNPGFPLKVESVIVDKVVSDTQTDLVLVTDNDGSPSEIIRLRMTIN